MAVRRSCTAARSRLRRRREARALPRCALRETRRGLAAQRVRGCRCGHAARARERAELLDVVGDTGDRLADRSRTPRRCCARSGASCVGAVYGQATTRSGRSDGDALEVERGGVADARQCARRRRPVAVPDRPDHGAHPAPAANSISVACGARLTMRCAGRASVTSLPASSTTLHRRTPRVRRRARQREGGRKLHGCQRTRGEHLRAAGRVVGSELVILVEHVVAAHEQRPPFRERPVERQVDDAIAAHRDRVRRVVVAKRRRDEFHADLRRSTCCSTLSAPCCRARRGSRLPVRRPPAAAGRAMPCTRVSRHVASTPSVTPFSVASSTFSGAQLKSASHWNTIRFVAPGCSSRSRAPPTATSRRGRPVGGHLGVARRLRHEVRVGEAGKVEIVERGRLESGAVARGQPPPGVNW